MEPLALSVDAMHYLAARQVEPLVVTLFGAGSGHLPREGVDLVNAHVAEGQD
jgi:hypothetical protein